MNSSAPATPDSQRTTSSNWPQIRVAFSSGNDVPTNAQGVTVGTEALDQTDWESAARWIAAHERMDNYMFSKQAINTYVAHEAFQLLRLGIRINAILPGPTDMPLARANADQWLRFSADYRHAGGIDTLQADQVANVMTFLCSDAARDINGVTVLVDNGHVASGLTGSFEAPLIKMLLGAE
jgi:NAD(P)-dependent dehydrogenase (short-subunit alcohol dehydrogenase family)